MRKGRKMTGHSSRRCRANNIFQEVVESFQQPQSSQAACLPTQHFMRSQFAWTHGVQCISTASLLTNPEFLLRFLH